MSAHATAQLRTPRVLADYPDPPRVVVADDDDDIRQAVGQALRHDGFDVVEIVDGEGLVTHLHACQRERRLPDLIITDHRMPVYSGVDVLAGLQEVGWHIPVILITAFGPEIRDVARALGASAVFDKPFELDDLLTAAHWSLQWEPPDPRAH